MLTEHRKIRIAHIITRMDRGGAPDIVRILFEKLDPGQFDLTLIHGPTLCPSGKSKKFIAALGPAAVLVPSLRRNINPFLDLAAFIGLWRILKKGGFDIVHAHTAKAGGLGRVAARLAGVPIVIYSPHGLDFYGYFGALGSRMVIAAEKIAALFCDTIHALTELEKKDLVSCRICRPEKIQVIYSGVELEVLRTPQAVRDSQAYAVGIVGRLEPVKGPQLFVEAAQLLAGESLDIKYFIVGDGSLKENLEEQVRKRGLSERFVFTGWKEDVSSVFAALDVVVLPSLNEAVGRSALEAQAVGVPVVATRVGGVPEVVKDGVTGLLVEPKDPKALAEAILSLLRDEKKRQGMSEAARGWVDERFSDRVMAEKFSDLYLKLFEGTHKR